MKLATFNINGINKRLPNLLRWLKSAKPDIVCLQELKCDTTAFPKAELQKAGYEAAWVGQRSWNGVAILSRESAPVVIRDKLPGDPRDKDARYLEAAVNGLIVASLYLPNGNPQPGTKFEYKMKWFARLARHAASLKKQQLPIVLAGDFNVAPTDLDIYPTRSWATDALIQPRPRKAFAALVDRGWTDAIRDVYGAERVYTFWTYWRNRYDQDHGLRLDHLLLTEDLSKQLNGAGVDGDVRGEEGASDHAPAWITLDRRDTK